MKVKNKELIQSYIFTTAKYDFDVYEKRILYRVVEKLQHLISGKELKFKYPVQEDLFGERLFTFDVTDFLNGEEDKNHSRIKKALRSLRDKTFEYDDGKVWEYLGIIEAPSLKHYEKTISFKVTPRVYEAFLDFSKGFKKFELELSMKFESVYAMRFYELFNNQKSPLTYSIPQLKDMFGLSEKYNGKSGNTNFINKVVIPAKLELDKHSPVSFNFKYKDRELKKAGKIYNIIFIPYEIPKNRNEKIVEKNLQKETSLRWDIPLDILNDLKRDFYFSEQEIKNNIEIFKEGVALPYYRDFYSLMKSKTITVKNPKGYFITGLKNDIEEHKKNNK